VLIFLEILKLANRSYLLCIFKVLYLFFMIFGLIFLYNYLLLSD